MTRHVKLFTRRVEESPCLLSPRRAIGHRWRAWATAQEMPGWAAKSPKQSNRFLTPCLSATLPNVTLENRTRLEKVLTREIRSS
jgi:hypothetical protein